MSANEIPGGLEPDETPWEEVEILDLDTTGLRRDGDQGEDDLPLEEEPDDWDGPFGGAPDGALVDEEDLDAVEDEPEPEDEAELLLLQELGIDLEATDSSLTAGDIEIDFEGDELADDEVAA